MQENPGGRISSEEGLRRGRLLTLGHSNRSPEKFVSLLEEFRVEAIADVRRYPSSRKYPHFNARRLRETLEAQGIDYVWFEALGGLRHGKQKEGSPHTGLQSPGFRNYADYMTTEEFREAVQGLVLLAARKLTAVMCAERLYWKCHRRLLSDFLSARGMEIAHILEPGRLQPHKMTPGAIVSEQGTVIYR